jgi:hypothetical protein
MDYVAKMRHKECVENSSEKTSLEAQEEMGG